VTLGLWAHPHATFRSRGMCRIATQVFRPMAEAASAQVHAQSRALAHDCAVVLTLATLHRKAAAGHAAALAHHRLGRIVQGC
jgi:hypothetical protein